MGVLNNSMWNVASGASNFYEHQIAKSFRWDSGYLKWTKTWITHEYERPGALWGINRKNYDKSW